MEGSRAEVKGKEEEQERKGKGRKGISDLNSDLNKWFVSIKGSENGIGNRRTKEEKDVKRRTKIRTEKEET